MLGSIVWTIIAIIGLYIVTKANPLFFQSVSEDEKEMMQAGQMPPKQEGRIPQYWQAYKEQKEELDIEERRKSRYGWPFYIADQLTQELKKKGTQKEVLLVPPGRLFFGGDSVKQAQYGGIVPEPAVFYYYTETKIVQKDCKNNCAAQWYVNVTPQGFTIEKINNKEQQDSVINSWSNVAADKY
jgi:hypothetical protein